MDNSDAPLPIQDVIDFYERWPEMRPRVAELARNENFAQSDQEILEWMIAVIDRVGPIDLLPEADDDMTDLQINQFPS